MTHVWTVRRDGNEIGTVEAVSRKGACHEAYDKFGIETSKRTTISVELLHRNITGHRSGLIQHEEYNSTGGWGRPCVVVIDPTKPGSDKTLDDCRQRFETGSFQSLPVKT